MEVWLPVSRSELVCVVGRIHSVRKSTLRIDKMPLKSIMKPCRIKVVPFYIRSFFEAHAQTIPCSRNIRGITCLAVLLCICSANKSRLALRYPSTPIKPDAKDRKRSEAGDACPQLERPLT